MNEAVEPTALLLLLLLEVEESELVLDWDGEEEASSLPVVPELEL